MEKRTGTGRAILFVEEEDTDDIEGYNLEDDFICPDLTCCSSRVSRYIRCVEKWCITLFEISLLLSSAFVLT